MQSGIALSPVRDAQLYRAVITLGGWSGEPAIENPGNSTGPGKCTDMPILAYYSRWYTVLKSSS